VSSAIVSAAAAGFAERSTANAIEGKMTWNRDFQRWRRYHRMVRELNDYSNHELSELGITRADIGRIALDANLQVAVRIGRGAGPLATKAEARLRNRAGLLCLPPFADTKKAARRRPFVDSPAEVSPSS
jgi:uncharacterized protein YjiS (DUF1127 family)